MLFFLRRFTVSQEETVGVSCRAFFNALNAGNWGVCAVVEHILSLQPSRPFITRQCMGSTPPLQQARECL